MDLFSLPNEMLASVLKYTKHESLKRVRGMNNRMDVIARKNKLDRPVIRRLRICRCYNDSSLFDAEITTEENFYDRSTTEKTTTSNLHNSKNETKGILNEILSKVRKINSVVLDNIIINEEFIENMSKYAKIFRKGVLFYSACQMQISGERLKNFVNVLQLDQMYLIVCNFEDPLTDEIIIGFNSTMNVSLFAYDPILTITARSLYGRTHNNRLNLAIVCSKTSITFKDMIEFLKKNKNVTTDMGFGTLCNVPKEFEEIEKLLKTELGAIDIKKSGVYIKFKPSHDGAEFQYVKFAVE